MGKRCLLKNKTNSEAIKEKKDIRILDEPNNFLSFPDSSAMYSAVYFDTDADMPKSQNINNNVNIEFKYIMIPNCSDVRKLAVMKRVNRESNPLTKS